MTDALIRGSIYQDTAPARATPAPTSPVRERLIGILEADLKNVWDDHQERSIKALLTVLEWHHPWQDWEQVFQPTYIGDRYRGVKCRSCDWSSPTDCPTVTAIAKAFGVEA